jgi:hypothetical protein
MTQSATAELRAPSRVACSDLLGGVIISQTLNLKPTINNTAPIRKAEAAQDKQPLTVPPVRHFAFGCRHFGHTAQIKHQME